MWDVTSLWISVFTAMSLPSSTTCEPEACVAWEGSSRDSKAIPATTHHDDHPACRFVHAQRHQNVTQHGGRATQHMLTLPPWLMFFRSRPTASTSRSVSRAALAATSARGVL